MLKEVSNKQELVKLKAEKEKIDGKKNSWFIKKSIKTSSRTDKIKRDKTQIRIKMPIQELNEGYHSRAHVY